MSLITCKTENISSRFYFHIFIIQEVEHDFYKLHTSKIFFFISLSIFFFFLFFSEIRSEASLVVEVKPKYPDTCTIQMRVWILHIWSNLIFEHGSHHDSMLLPGEPKKATQLKKNKDSLPFNLFTFFFLHLCLPWHL